MAAVRRPGVRRPGHLSAPATLWLAALAYAMQVYCDFSGYSDMALGTAHLLGYKLTQNFNLPYLAANVAEFWRRWHISLSSWLRDYLFIPLGGSRGGPWRTAPQPDHHHDARRAVARGRLDVRRLRLHPRMLAQRVTERSAAGVKVGRDWPHC